MTSAVTGPRRGWIDPQRSFSGSRCAHGYPDLSCADLVTGDSEGNAYMYECGVPEYVVFKIAASLGAFPALRRWARPCGACRQDFLSGHYGLLEDEMRRLCGALSKRSLGAQAEVHLVQEYINTVFGLMDDIDGLEDEIRASNPSASGYVYAISNGAAVKIGWSSSHPGLPAGRMAQLQTAHVEELRLIGALLAAPELERTLHARFAEHRIRGEWFRCVPEIVEYFDKHEEAAQE